jgi:hypothetical protein
VFPVHAAATKALADGAQDGMLDREARRRPWLFGLVACGRWVRLND